MECGFFPNGTSALPPPHHKAILSIESLALGLNPGWLTQMVRRWACSTYNPFLKKNAILISTAGVRSESLCS